ncbi:hypothetical protein FRIG_15660, partial [Frigoribacterium faeni]|uniref:hypothetical protein n=1 Tax=Frigoribacterium faeni TaxID=145483 RepID=UPI001FAE610C
MCIRDRYKTLPAALLQAVAPGSVAAFAAVDRLARAGLGIVAVVPQRLQVWVGSPDETVAARRTVASLVLNAGLAAASAVTVLTAMPPVVAVVFTGAVTVEGSAVVATALLVALTCPSRAFGLAPVAPDAGPATAPRGPAAPAGGG